jgi:transcription elongation GreA/GreB family factor
MIGREEGDTVSLRNAKGSREYQVLSVAFLAID